MKYPVQFDSKKRQVHLSGEAYFKVSRNEGMPFLISTGPLNIKVLGTTFNVEAYPEDENITTTLEEGSVKVYRSSYPEKEGIIMKPDERLVYHNQNDKFELYKVESEDFTAWTNGELYFVEQPLSVILKTIERRCNVFFRYDSQINLEDTYTIKFKADESIEDMMRVLTFLAGDIGYAIKGRTILLQSNTKGGDTQ